MQRISACRTFWLLALLLALSGWQWSVVRAATPVDPASVKNLRENANSDYDEGKFGAAKDAYEKLVESGAGNANIYYNLGNTEFRLGSIGRAVLDYERALNLNPRHPEAQANLKLLRQKSGARLRPLSWGERLAVTLPANAWSIVAAVSGWLILLGLVLIFLRRQQDNLGWWTVSLFGVVVFAVSLLALRSVLRDQKLAIITAQQTEARLAPAESAGVAEALPAGSQVRVLSERGAWVYCELPGSGRGWVPEDAVEQVRPARL